MLPVRAAIARASLGRLCGGAAVTRRFSGGGGAEKGSSSRVVAAYNKFEDTLFALMPSKTYDAEYVSPKNGAPRLPSPWNKWFPYEPVPCSPKLGPYVVHCEGGKLYNWCACGESRTQPWCDCGGVYSRSKGFAPVQYIPQHSGIKLMCGSKHSGSAPLFNGTCWIKWCDHNTTEACAVGFVISFFFGIFTTWMAHP